MFNKNAGSEPFDSQTRKVIRVKVYSVANRRRRFHSSLISIGGKRCAVSVEHAVL